MYQDIINSLQELKLSLVVANEELVASSDQFTQELKNILSNPKYDAKIIKRMVEGKGDDSIPIS